MSLTRDQWSQVEALFTEAQQQPAGQRLAWLEHKAGRRADPAVIGEVKALLVTYESDAPELEIILASSKIGEVGDVISAVGEALGPWRLLRLLGRGGMGEVYLAERADGAYQQQVAVKLLKRGLDTDAVLRRFLRERRILASLSHPNIARLLDGGAASDGRPYLVMEYVHGQPITSWCREQPHALRQILELMVGVCEAVHTAHRQQIVHRDLKPSNILVGEDGSAKLLDFGVAKLLDFGIAKLLGDENTDTTQTILGGAPLTPQYAAPEQLLGQPVTPATDVYALGVLLYELLTGQAPLRHQNALAAVWAAQDEQPLARPSAALRKDSTIAEPERAAQRTRAKELDGDLDQIVLKALERQPQRRYGSAAELADDLRRHLDGRPVLARPDAWLYVARKFVLRNWVPVSAATAVTLALILGLTATLWQARIARGQALIADQRAAELSTVVDFQSAMLKRVDVYTLGTAWIDQMRAKISDKLDKDHPLPPAQAQAALANFDQLRVWAQPSEVARKTLSNYLLEPARAEIGKRFAADPATAGRLHYSLGQAYKDLGAYANARGEFQSAIAEQTAALGANHPDTLNSGLKLSLVEADLGDYKTSVATAQAVLEARARVLGATHRDTLSARSIYADGLARQGEYAQALSVAEPLFQLQRRLFGDEDADTLHTEQVLAYIHSSQGDSVGALPLARHVLEVRRRILGDENPDTLTAMNELSYDLNDLGDYAAVRTLDEETLAIRRRVLGDDHPYTLSTLANLALTLSNLGDKAGALRIQRELWLRDKRAQDETNPRSIQDAENYALTLSYLGELDETPAIERHVLELRTRMLGPEHPDTLYSQGILSQILADKKQYAAALPLLRRTLEADRRVLGADHPQTLEIQVYLGITLLNAGDAGAAMNELTTAWERLRATRGADYPEALIATANIGKAHRLVGEYQISQTQLEANLAVQKRVIGDEHPDTLDTETKLAETLHALHRDAEAQKLAASIVDSWRKKFGDTAQGTIDAERALAGYDAALGQRAEALALHRQAGQAEQRLHAQWAADAGSLMKSGS